jgi:hypothetical protein
MSSEKTNWDSRFGFVVRYGAQQEAEKTVYRGAPEQP